MSDIQEKKDAVLKKLTKAQQKKLSLQEQIDYLKKEQEQIQEQAKQKQNELKLKQQKLLKEEFPNLKKIVVGYDFCFGHNRSCCAEDLKNLFDGDVEVVEAFSYKGTAIHSSGIRVYLKEGRVDEANRFLGREYSMTGNVVEGQGLGKKELVPTLNLKVLDYLVPKSGVYATRTKIEHT